MTSDPHDLRIGDHERTEAGERLSAHAAAGRLSMDELEQRLERVQSAVFARDLVALEADLPGPSVRRPASQQGVPAAAIALLVAAVLATVVVGHPVVPLFIGAVLLWRARRRGPQRRLALPRSLP